MSTMQKACACGCGSMLRLKIRKADHVTIFNIITPRLNVIIFGKAAELTTAVMSGFAQKDTHTLKKTDIMF